MRSVPRHLVSIADLEAAEIIAILDHGDRYWPSISSGGAEAIQKQTSLRGRTVFAECMSVFDDLRDMEQQFPLRGWRSRPNTAHQP